jgi:hypothetical protein
LPVEAGYLLHLEILKQRIEIKGMQCNGYDAQIDFRGGQKITGNVEKL